VTGKTSEFVFCNRNGTPIDNQNFLNRVWSPLLRHLDIPHRRAYQMRHTAATLWLASGEAPEWIARQLGHTSTEMLFRVYSRYVPNLTRRDGSAMERLLKQHISVAPVQGSVIRLLEEAQTVELVEHERTPGVQPNESDAPAGGDQASALYASTASHQHAADTAKGEAHSNKPPVEVLFPRSAARRKHATKAQSLSPLSSLRSATSAERSPQD